MRNYSTQIKNELKDKIDLVSGRKEGAPDYFAYIRGSGITEDTQESGYRGAVAAALRALNEYDTALQTDADLFIRTIEDVYTAAQEADANCYAKLRAVIESLQEWKLLARKLNLSITGGGGYQDQLFTANNIRCWVGNVPQTVDQASVDCWKDIFTDIDPTTGEATYNQAALTDYFALSEEVYTQDSPNSVFAIMTAGLVEATDLVCLTSDRNFNAEQFNLLMQCGTTQIFSADNPLQMCGLPTSVKQLDAEYYYVSYNVSPVLQLFSNTYNAMIDCKLYYGPDLTLTHNSESETEYAYLRNITQQEAFASILKYTTTGNCISIGIPFTDEEIETAKNAISAGDAPQYILDNISTDFDGTVDSFVSVGTYVESELKISFADIYAHYSDSGSCGVRIENPIIISDVDWGNEYTAPSSSVNVLKSECEYLDYYFMSAVADNATLQSLITSKTAALMTDENEAIIDSISSSMTEYAVTYSLSKLPLADELKFGIDLVKIGQNGVMAYSQAIENNMKVGLILDAEKVEHSIEATGAVVSMLIDDSGRIEVERTQLCPAYIQEKLCYLAWANRFITLHTYDELVNQSGNMYFSENTYDNLVKEDWDREWSYIYFRNEGTDPSDRSFETFESSLVQAWSEYCTKTGHDEYSCIQIRELTAEDIVKLAESLPDNGNREINIDLSQYTPYLKYYN